MVLILTATIFIRKFLVLGIFVNFPENTWLLGSSISLFLKVLVCGHLILPEHHMEVYKLDQKDDSHWVKGYRDWEYHFKLNSHITSIELQADKIISEVNW